MIAIDTNILVYAHRAGSTEHASARHALERATGGDWGIALASVVEFVAVVTQRSLRGGPSTVEQAGKFIRTLEDAGAAICVPGASFPGRLVSAAERLGVTGRAVFDLQIALTVADAGATTIWTHDRGFLHLPGLRVEDPLAVP